MLRVVSIAGRVSALSTIPSLKIEMPNCPLNGSSVYPDIESR